MSGGKFDYQQYRIRDIADSIEDYVNGHPLDEDEINSINRDTFMKKYYPETVKYINENKHTILNAYEYSEDTINKFKEGIKILRMAEIYAQRIDWLLSGDDGEDDFHKRLKEDLEELNYDTDE